MDDWRKGRGLIQWLTRASLGNQITTNKLITHLLKMARLHNKNIKGLFSPNNIRLIYQYSLSVPGETTP
jgi:hypothetical protein